MHTRWVLLIMAGLASSGIARADDGPKAAVRSAVDGVIQVLDQRTGRDPLTPDERAAIHRAVDPHFDYREMAKRSLGKPWRKLDEARRDEFTNVFRDLLERSYGNRLAAYKNQKVEYGEVRQKENKARVSTNIIDANKSIPVQYILHRTANGWMVYDIKIEGLSLVSTFRADFKGVVKKDGFDGLLRSLKDKVRRLREADAARV